MRCLFFFNFITLKLYNHPRISFQALNHCPAVDMSEERAMQTSNPNFSGVDQSGNHLLGSVVNAENVWLDHPTSSKNFPWKLNT